MRNAFRGLITTNWALKVVADICPVAMWILRASKGLSIAPFSTIRVKDTVAAIVDSRLAAYQSEHNRGISESNKFSN